MKDKIEKLLNALSKGAFEREEIISLALLSALSGESIFLLGLPGVGKSMIARRLKMAFKNSQSFEYLMSRFSTPDEIFGPVSISKLKDKDTYERVVDGYLPTADVVFLDEIWKAGPAIQNSLLTVLNEKVFRNGKQEIALPLKTVISASNELPAEGEGLEALWDRFLIRYVVKPIEDKSNFISLISDQLETCEIAENLKFTKKDLQEIQKGSNHIKLTWEISELMFAIRKTLTDERNNMNESVDVTQSDIVDPPYVSDRRWRKIVSVLRTCAYLNGRDKVNASDCVLLIHMLWDNDEQIYSVKKLVAQAITQNMKHFHVDVMSKIEGQKFTKPVGEPILPDGKHYIFIVGDEDVKISKSDYESLSEKNRYGVMSDDGILLLCDDPTGLSVRKSEDGLIINLYKYPLKRDSNLRTGSVKGMIDTVKTEVNALENELKEQVNDNLFLGSYEQYHFLRKAFVDMKNNFSKKGY